MKKLLILLLLVSGLAKAQIPAVPGYTGINSGYIWYKGGFQQLNLPAYGDTALQPGQWRRAGAVLVDTSGSNKGLYFWMDGKWNLVAAGALAVTNIATNNGSGIVGGPITSTGTLAIDTLLTIATKDWVNSQGFGSGGGGSGVVSAGAQYRLAYYAATGTTVSESGAITGDRALISDVNGVPTHAAVTATELNYLSGVTSALQTQINAKGAGTVTSVATNSGSGITGGTITGTGTLAIDTTSTIQKKLSYTAPITKNNNTLSLAGWSSTLPNSVYGADASGVGIMRRAAIIDTALRHNGWSVVWDSVNSKHVYSYITGSGGGSSGIRPKWLLMQVGVSYNAIAAGTTTIVHDSLIGHGVELAIDGHAMQPNSTEADGYTYTPGTGTIELVTPVTASSKIRILRVSDNIDTLTAQAPPVSWQYMAFTSPTLFTNTSNVYTAGSGSGWGSYALGTTPFIGDMSIRTQHVSSAQEYIVGLRTTNAAGDFTGYYVGYAVTGGVLYRLESGGSGSLSYSMSANEYARIVRSGSTFLIQVSMDGNTWTTKHTSSNTGSGTYYVNLNLYAQSPLGKAYYMMYK